MATGLGEAICIYEAAESPASLQCFRQNKMTLAGLVPALKRCTDILSRSTMGLEFLLAGGVSAIAGFVVNFISVLLTEPRFAATKIGKLLVRLGYRTKKEESFSDRLARLATELSRASTEVDETLAEIETVAEQRQKIVQQLEKDMSDLSAREKELKDRITALEGVPLPAAEHFVKLSAPGERRSAWRDYILFLAGVVLSTIIAILLSILGFG